MLDPPAAPRLLTLVETFLREPGGAGESDFHRRVAANAVGLAVRELELGPSLETAEKARLTALVGATGTLDQLNHTLCARIRTGELGLISPALVAHLKATALGKLSVDQPAYAAYLAARAAWAETHSAPDCASREDA